MTSVPADEVPIQLAIDPELNNDGPVANGPVAGRSNRPDSVVVSNNAASWEDNAYVSSEVDSDKSDSDLEYENEDSTSEGRILWTKLEHHGICFPPEYKPHQPLPRSAYLRYEGEPVQLPLEAEEIAYSYARVMDRPLSQTPTFIANFFSDLNEALVRHGASQLSDFSQCEFLPMRDYYLEFQAPKKRIGARARPSPFLDKYRWCWVDGEHCEVNYYKLDPPGLYFGASLTAELSGKFVRRVRPEEITINISPGFEDQVKPPYGHWKAIISDRTQMWLAEYQHPVVGLQRTLVAGHRAWIGSQRQHEIARDLGYYLWRVRADYNKDLRSTLSIKREVATLLWFVDLLGLRLAATRNPSRFDYDLGLASLQCGDLILSDPNIIEIRLKGPHNLTFTKTVVAPPVVFANLQFFMRNKGPEDHVFKLLSGRAALRQLSRYRRNLSPVSFKAFSYSRALQLALDEYEGTVLYKYIPRRHIDRIEVFDLIRRKVAAIMKMIPQVSADNDHQNPRIELYKWALFRLKMKLKVLNPAFVVGETMNVEKYRELGLRYAYEIEPRLRKNYMIEIAQETAAGFVQLTNNITIPNDPVYVWDLIYDKMLLIDLERLRMIDPCLAVDLMHDWLIDPRIIVAYAKRNGIAIHRLVRNSSRTRWAYTASPQFRY